MQRPVPNSLARKSWWWIFDPRQSLRARVTLLVGIGTIAFIAVLVWTTEALFRQELQRQLSTNFETLAFQVSDKLDRAIYERYRSLVTTSSLAVIRDNAAKITDRRRVFTALQESSPEFAWLGLVDESGRVVVGSNGVLEGSNVAMRPWFRSGRERPFMGGVHEMPELPPALTTNVDGETSARFFDIAVPVMGMDGQFAGVLAGYVKWNWSRDVQASVISETATRDQIGVTVYALTGEVLLDSGASGWTAPPEATVITDTKRLRGAMIERTAGGTVYLSGFARSRGFREYRGIGWLSVVRQPVGRAFGPVITLRRSLVAWGTVLVAIACTCSWVIAGRHARKLRSIRASAERIQEGDILTVLPQPKGQSETAAMCGALNDLVQDLRAQREALLAENARLKSQLREGDAARR